MKRSRTSFHHSNSDLVNKQTCFTAETAVEDLIAIKRTYCGIKHGLSAARGQLEIENDVQRTLLRLKHENDVVKGIACSVIVKIFSATGHLLSMEYASSVVAELKTLIVESWDLTKDMPVEDDLPFDLAKDDSDTPVLAFPVATITLGTVCYGRLQVSKYPKVVLAGHAIWALIQIFKSSPTPPFSSVLDLNDILISIIQKCKGDTLAAALLFFRIIFSTNHSNYTEWCSIDAVVRAILGVIEGSCAAIRDIAFRVIDCLALHNAKARELLLEFGFLDHLAGALTQVSPGVVQSALSASYSICPINAPIDVKTLFQTKDNGMVIRAIINLLDEGMVYCAVCKILINIMAGNTDGIIYAVYKCGLIRRLDECLYASRTRGEREDLKLLLTIMRLVVDTKEVQLDSFPACTRIFKSINMMLLNKSAVVKAISAYIMYQLIKRTDTWNKELAKDGIICHLFEILQQNASDVAEKEGFTPH